MKNVTLIPNLFKSEFGRITSVLSRLLGLQHMQVAEDITSETFALALETWPYKGIPEHPRSWLYAVAKNKAYNYLKRHQIFFEKISPVIAQNQIENTTETEISDEHITDSQLRMLFALCHPSLPTASQIGLSLRILCGLGVEEIANAFLTNKDAINKRLFRAREIIRAEKIQIEFPDEKSIITRLDSVLATLYLLFNEGYYSESKEGVIREDLCEEAVHLTKLLLDHDKTNLPKVHALIALMYFQSSRFAARKNSRGELILYDDQDRTLWDENRITVGAQHLRTASTGNTLSKYHLEAAIAFWYASKDGGEDKWQSILQLYNRLLQLEYSPIAALNRTYAFSKCYGNERAIAEAEKLQMKNNRYYFALLGELYKGIDKEKSQDNFSKALALAKTESDKTLLRLQLQNTFVE